MSSSYSSVDWVLSHWAHSTVHRFYLCSSLYFAYFGIMLHVLYIMSMVGWTWLDWSLSL